MSEEQRQFVIGQITLDGGHSLGLPGHKSFDSETVRRLEPVSAAHYDIQYAISCCDELLTNPVASVEGNATLQRSLWDGVLVALFKHYGRGAKQEIKRIIDEVLQQRGAAYVEAFRDWGDERNKRASHSAGYRETHGVVVEIVGSGEPLRLRPLAIAALRPEDAGVQVVRDVLVDIESRLHEEADRLMRTIVEEVNALSDDDILALPDAHIESIGMGRAPGSKRAPRERKPRGG